MYQGKWWWMTGQEGNCPGHGEGLGRKPAPPLGGLLSAQRSLATRDFIMWINTHLERWPGPRYLPHSA